MSVIIIATDYQSLFTSDIYHLLLFITEYCGIIYGDNFLSNFIFAWIINEYCGTCTQAIVEDVIFGIRRTQKIKNWVTINFNDPAVLVYTCILFNFDSSFDEYTSEVKSGRLEWSPVHKNEKFWRENAIRLNENNYSLLK